VSGLSGSGLKLKLNDGNELSVTQSGKFTFETELASGTDYAVTVSAQPSNPVQACTVADGSGKIDKADVSVKITCNTATRTIGGTITGLGGGTVVLKNGSETLSRNADGGFTFATAIKQGDNYAVSVQTQPTGRSCSVANASGTAGASNVDNVNVNCYADLKLLPKARVGGVQLSWDNNGATAYNVYVSTDAACNWDNAGSCAGADHKDGVTSPYLWTGLTDGTVYYFQVRGSHPNDFVTRSPAVGTRPNRVQIDDSVQAIVTSQGTTYIGGRFNSIGAYTGGVVPIDVQTGLTTRIPNFPLVDQTVYAIVPDGNNGYFIGGEFTRIGGSDRARLAHILPNGNVDPDFMPEPDGAVSVLAVSGNTLFVGGAFTQIGGQARTRLASINIMTRAVSDWSPAPDGLPTALAVTSDTLYVGGDFANIAGMARSALAAFPLTNGVPGTLKSWAPNPNVVGIPALYVANGKLYVSGYFNTIAGQGRTRIAAFDAVSGALDASFVTTVSAPDDDVIGFALAGGRLYVAGEFTALGSQTRSHIGALDPSTGMVLDALPAVDGNVSAIVAVGDKIYFGGDFGNVGNAARRGLAALTSAGAVDAWNPSPDGPISSLALSGDTLYVVGNTRTYGAEPRAKLASFSGGSLTNWAPAVAGGDVYALALSGTTVYAGGDFETVGGAARRGVAAIDGNAAATAWNAQLDNSGSVYALATDDMRVFLGGDFTAAGGGNRSNLAAVSLTTGAATAGFTPPAPDQPVRALARGGDRLYLGGDFQNLDVTARAHVAAVQVSDGMLAAWNPGANERVLAVRVVKDVDVYVGGEFTQLGGAARNYIGSVAADSGSLNAWDPNLNGRVLGLGHGHNTVFAVGDFGSVGTGMTAVALQYLAGWDDGTGTLQTGNPNLSDVGYAVAADDNYLYLGGDFTSVGGVDSSRYYRYGF